ncbi:MAG: hypothetical protein K2N44_11350 [Lachnospiraceae bacterium]|nr:hypothetical protein [Lachnospiraceae bacterium]MDE7416872.1 hypothetical protein [Lachnospiraceae bacterium]
MDNTFLTQITNGMIEDVETGRNGSFVLVSYRDCPNCSRDNQTIRLNVGNNTVIMDENSSRIQLADLRTGMTVNAAFSNATTRSIPPQASAYVIQVVGRPRNDNVTVGRIVDVNRQNRSFATISDGNPSSVMRFNLADDAQILNGMGRPMNFSNLVPGLRVRVRHAAFMTMSIPPQTTAFEVRVIR